MDITKSIEKLNKQARKSKPKKAKAFKQQRKLDRKRKEFRQQGDLS
jgi:hypothetical protein